MGLIIIEGEVQIPKESFNTIKALLKDDFER